MRRWRVPDPWAYPGWAWRAPLTIDGTVAALTGAVSGAIAIPGVPAGLKAVCRAAGQDIRWALADGTPLSYAIESWSAAEPVVHALVPSVGVGNTLVYAYGGKVDAAAADNRAAVAAGYALYMPLGDAGPTTVEDWSSNANHGTQSGGVAFGAAGKVNGACSFDGSDDRFALPAMLAVGPTSTFTLSAWVNPATTQTGSGDRRCAIAIAVAKNDFEAIIGSPYGGGSYLSLEVGKAYVGSQAKNAPATYVTGSWYHVVGVFGNGSAELFVNGVSQGTLIYDSTTNSATVNGNAWAIGTEPDLFAGNYPYRWRGSVDGTAITASTLSADAIAFAAWSRPGSAMFSWGALEAAPSAVFAYYRHLLRRSA